jgi:AmmeMemoRadiSam system protein B
MSRVRKPAVAGLFYPSQPAALLSAVQALLAVPGAEPAPAVAAIAPHAGYQYSGPTAGAVFARVAAPRRVIVVAPNHTGAGRSTHGGSVYAVGALRTPLADIPVDELLAADLLARCHLLEDDPDAHRTEHAVEVLLPLLLAGRPDVTVVPILLGWSDWPRTRELAEALADAVRASDEPVLLLASSDMNHYEAVGVSREKDDLALREIARLDGEALLDVTKRHRISMCGRVPAAAVLHAARLLGATGADVVDYSHSGMVTHDESAVVGYAGVVIT